MKQLRTDKAQAKVLEHLVEAKSLSELAELAGCERQTIWYWLQNDPEFKTSYTSILQNLVEEAIDRAKSSAATRVGVLVNIAMDEDHPQCLGANKELHRILEKREDSPSSIELKLEF